MYPVGKVFGFYASALIGDRYGRKVPLGSGLCILLVGAALQGAAQNLLMYVEGSPYEFPRTDVA